MRNILRLDNEQGARNLSLYMRDIEEKTPVFFVMEPNKNNPVPEALAEYVKTNYSEMTIGGSRLAHFRLYKRNRRDESQP
jgi:hypothetical protein